mgnify:CR=1 FL=1
MLLAVLDLRPQGLPVLQSTQPLPLFWLNHFLKPPLVLLFLFLGTFITPVLCPYFSALHKCARSIRTRPGSTISGVPSLYLPVTRISFCFFLFDRHNYCASLFVSSAILLSAPSPVPPINDKKPPFLIKFCKT